MQEDQSFPFPRVRRREEPHASNYGGENASSNAPILTPPAESAGLGPAVPGFSPMTDEERERERDMTIGPNVVVRSSRAAARQPVPSGASSTSSEATLPHQPHSWPDGSVPGMTMQDGALPRQNTYPPTSPMSPGIIRGGENGGQSAFAQAANYPPQMHQPAPPQTMQMQPPMPPMPAQPVGGIMPGAPFMNAPVPPMGPPMVQQQLRTAPPLYLYAIPPGGPGTTGQSPTTNGVPECKFFKLGHCAKGDKCRFIHVPKKEEED